jgi:UPF0755 protein
MLAAVFDWAEEGDQGEEKPGARHRRRRRHRGLIVLLVLMLVVLGLATAGFTYYRWCQGSSGPQTAVTITVPRGASGGDVVGLLHDRGVIRCGLVSRVILRTRNDTFQAGKYHLRTNMTLSGALDALDRGPLAAPSIRLTIPEGWRLTQIADRVQALLHVPSAGFLRLAQSGRYSLPPYLPSKSRSVEGLLFPNTYQFPAHGNTAGSVIRKLLDGFRAAVRSLPWADALNLHVSDYQIVTIASMIEREARIPRDRPKIAAVIYNRLKRGMSLGIDATVEYIDPNPSNGLTNSDLHIKSPYNTRLHPGLPPTPIASPGLPSLRAALQPAHVDYLYFVLCGADGHHAFTDTNARFQELEARCLG